MRRFLLLTLLFCSVCPGASAYGDEGRLTTLWPLFDYRRSEAVDYTSLSILGPIFSYQSKGDEREVAVRPFFFGARDRKSQASYREYLFPVARSEKDPEQRRLNILRLFDHDLGGQKDGSGDRFTLFPFVFSGTARHKGNFFAIFPLGGRIYDRFGRDQIDFALFPLYGRTQRKGTQVTNIVWPFGAKISGVQESGFKLWPLYGRSQKAGVYSKRFALWPFHFEYHLGLDTDNPRHKRLYFPFYLREESPDRGSRTFLWPFFSHRIDRVRHFEQYDFPWPLVRLTTGETVHGLRLLPFYADETAGEKRKRWYGWPLYKIEQIDSRFFQSRRDRVLVFLYSDLRETRTGEEGLHKRRISLWPLFTYERLRGVSRFQTLSLLEPFFPGSDGIRRSWSPLWGIYQRKWDGHGNSATSVLWHLYWQETRGDERALELFPLFSFKREAQKGVDFKLLKGLIRYKSSEQGRRLHLFYLPWGIPLRQAGPMRPTG